MIFDELNSAWTLFERVLGLFKRGKPHDQEQESVAARLVHLFEAHGVHRNQIPRFIGHGLTVKDVKDEDSLLAKLDEPLLDATCEMFAVRREWLDGVDQQVHITHDFYKYPKEFARFLDTILNTEDSGSIIGVVIAPEEKNWDAHALLILQETVGHIGEKAIYRFHICNNWAFTYWKARAFLTACVAIAWKRDAYIHGISMPVEEIRRLESGNTLLGWSGEGIWELGHVTWHPEDMALKPDTFLKYVNPEKNKFGIRSGLELWLALAEEGLMDAGLGTQPRRLFEDELRKYVITGDVP